MDDVGIVVDEQRMVRVVGVLVNDLHDAVDEHAFFVDGLEEEEEEEEDDDDGDDDDDKDEDVDVDKEKCKKASENGSSK